MTDDIDWTRLARYFAGESTPEEADEIRHGIEADSERRRVVEEMRAAWEAAVTPSTVWDTPAAWRRLAARLHSRERRPRLAVVRGAWPDGGQTGWSRTARPAAIAAAALLVVGGGLVWRGVMVGPDRTGATAAPLREVRTLPGHRARFQLIDGSRVLLAPGSLLRYDTTASVSPPARFSSRAGGTSRSPTIRGAPSWFTPPAR